MPLLMMCRNGHEKTPENTYINPRGDFECRICRSIAGKKRNKGYCTRSHPVTEMKRDVLGRPYCAGCRRVARRLRPKRLACNRGHLYSVHGRLRKGGILRCKKCGNIALAGSVKKETITQLLDGLSHELTLNQMTAHEKSRSWRPDGAISRIIRPTVLWSFMKEHPTIGKRMKVLSQKNAAENYRAAGLTRIRVASPAILRNDGLDAFNAIQRATAHIWEGDRGDVQSLMYIAIGERRLSLSSCTRAAADKFLEQHRKRPRVLGDARYSLDNPLGDDSGMTWLDTKMEADRLWG
ncbi:hypothetical protein SAMN05443247_11540 [Bradyrhizobium erythrophlei]|nr:hypothetical protein SAMN05443247_11540 [Bradyrhizobium erythrophlei]